MNGDFESIWGWHWRRMAMKFCTGNKKKEGQNGRPTPIESGTVPEDRQ